jgi:hypothetical protein
MAAMAENSNEQRTFGRPFPKGTSGNPGGRPKGDAWFRELCRKRTVRALKALTEALEDPATRVSAAKALLEFGWGKAPAVIDVKAKSEDNPARPLTTEQLLAIASTKH